MYGKAPHGPAHAVTIGPQKHRRRRCRPGRGRSRGLARHRDQRRLWLRLCLLLPCYHGRDTTWRHRPATTVMGRPSSQSAPRKTERWRDKPMGCGCCAGKGGTSGERDCGKEGCTERGGAAPQARPRSGPETQNQPWGRPESLKPGLNPLTQLEIP